MQLINLLAVALAGGSWAQVAPRHVPRECDGLEALSVQNFTYMALFRPFHNGRPAAWKETLISFDLFNPSLDYRPHCAGKGVYRGEHLIHQCDLLPPGQNTTFAFDRRSHTLSLNQTWTCPLDGKKLETRASVAMNLTCVWETMPQANFGAVKCEKGDHQVPILA